MQNRDGEADRENTADSGNRDRPQCAQIILPPHHSVSALWQPTLAEQPIRIGASMSLTGKAYSVQGGYGREGYLLCQKHVTAQGGVPGRPIGFVIRDDGSDEKTAVHLYETLITEDKVDAVPGPYGSAITDAVADITEKHRMLMISPNASTTSIWEKGRRYLIMTVSPDHAASDRAESFKCSCVIQPDQAAVTHRIGIHDRD